MCFSCAALRSVPSQSALRLTAPPKGEPFLLCLFVLSLAPWRSPPQRTPIGALCILIVSPSGGGAPKGRRGLHLYCIEQEQLQLFCIAIVLVLVLSCIVLYWHALHHGKAKCAICIELPPFHPDKRAVPSTQCCQMSFPLSFSLGAGLPKPPL